MRRYMVLWQDVKDIDVAPSLGAAVRHAEFIVDSGSGDVDEIRQVDVIDEGEIRVYTVTATWTWREAQERLAEMLDAEEGSVLHS